MSKGVQAIFVQKYCNYCLAEQRRESFVPKHAVKCHKCKERNLALLLPYHSPCQICASTNLHSKAIIHTLNQSPQKRLKCESIKSASGALEQTLDTLMVNVITEAGGFIECHAKVMTSGEFPCYDLATNLEFNNMVYAYIKLFEVVEVFLKHSQSVSRKGVLLGLIENFHKKIHGFT